MVIFASLLLIRWRINHVSRFSLSLAGHGPAPLCSGPYLMRIPTYRSPGNASLSSTFTRSTENWNYWNTETLEHFYSDLLKQWQFSAWNIDHDKLQSDLQACAGVTSYAMICQVVYLNHISFYPKEDIKLIGDKNHGYTIYTERLLKLFPGAKFVYILRDYRDTYQSVKNVDFELPVVSVVVYKWKYFYKKALQAIEKIPGFILLHPVRRPCDQS